MWYPTWQVWILSVEIVGRFLGTTLEGRHDGMCNGNLGYMLRVCDLQETLGYNPWMSPSSHPEFGLAWYSRAMALENPWILIGWECQRPCLEFTWGQFWIAAHNIFNGQNLCDIPHGKYESLVGTVWIFFGTTLGGKPDKMNNKNLGLCIEAFAMLHPTINDDWCVSIYI